MSANLNVLDDPRWTAFNQTGFVCSCGERHVGLIPINMLMPLGWDGPTTYQPDSQLTLTGNFLSESYCVWEGQSFAIRMRLPLQMRGAAPHAFMYTVWASVDRPRFEAFLEAKATNNFNSKTYFPARLISRIAGHHDTANLMGAAFQQEDGGPPLLLLVGPQPYTNLPDNPIIAEQKDGIGLDRALDLLAAYGHDMRASASANAN